MRLKPAVASGTIRVALRDVVLGRGKHRIPAGTGLWTPSYAMHNSKLNWGPDADVFRPVSQSAANTLLHYHGLLHTMNGIRKLHVLC